MHRLARSAALVACVVLAVTAGSVSARADADKVTGGGQVFASADGMGSGDSLGFSATRGGGRISGSFQATRTTQAGAAMPIFNGAVTCLEVTSGETARFGGVARFDSAGGAEGFVVDVQDTGESGNDTIVFRRADPDDPCEDDQGSPQVTGTLARGNLTVHDAD